MASIRISCSILPAFFLMAGCRESDRIEEQKPAGSSIQPTDSVVLSSPSGTEVGFSLTRSSRSEDGTPCTERGLVIRREGSRIQVPLLYTGEPPTLLNDSTMRARLWTNCRPATAYLVDLRTGRPVPERERNPAR